MKSTHIIRDPSFFANLKDEVTEQIDELVEDIKFKIWARFDDAEPNQEDYYDYM